MNISDIDTIRKRQFAYFCIAFSLPITLAFLVLDIIEGQRLEVMADSLLFLVLLFGYAGIRKYKADMKIYRATLSPLGIVFLYNVSIGAGNGTVLYWISPLPLIFLFFLGKREGGLVTCIFFFATCILLINPFSAKTYSYDIGTCARFLFSQVMVISMAYGLEAAREKFGALLIEKLKKLLAEKHHLEQALGKIKTLSGLIPICSSCKKIRDDKGYWQQVKVYVRDHSTADFSHGICPDCIGEYYKDLNRMVKG